MKKILFVETVLLMMGSIFLSGAFSIVANAEENTNAVINSENIQPSQNINTDYNTLKNSLILRGFHVSEENTFYYEGLQYTKYFSDNGDIGVIELGADYVTAYTLKESGFLYTLTAENAAGTTLYKQFTKNGDPVNMLSRRATMCDWVVGGSGVALSAIYGGAIGAAFGGPAGLVAGAAVGLGWIPVSAACPK